MFSAGLIEAAATLDDSQYREKLNGMPGLAQNALGKVAALAAGYLSFRGAMAGIKKTVSAFGVQEKAVMSVQAALRKQGVEWNLQSQKIMNFAGDMQKLTVYGDEMTAQTMALGMNMGISNEKIEDATKAAMGLAAAYNMDLNTSMQLVAKANTGQTGALSRYGIVLDQAKNKEAQFNQLMEIGAESFQIAETNADTLIGKTGQATNNFGDLLEKIGEFFVELAGAKEGMETVPEAISAATDYLTKNLDYWVFEIKYVSAYIEAGIKAVWAVFEPAVTFIWQEFKTAGENIVSIGKWAFENFGKIWENLPEIFVGIGKDILNAWKNIFNGLLDLAVNLGKAVWAAVKGEGLSGFKEAFDKLCQDAVKFASEAGNFTAEAMEKAGVSAFPELKSGDFGGMIDKYRNIGDTFDKIDRDRAQKQYDLELNLVKKLEEKKTAKGGPEKKQAGGPDAIKWKTDVAGSFSAAMLSAMLGSGTPEQETAKNTRELVRLQRQAIETAASYV